MSKKVVLVAPFQRYAFFSPLGSLASTCSQVSSYFCKTKKAVYCKDVFLKLFLLIIMKLGLDF